VRTSIILSTKPAIERKNKYLFSWIVVFLTNTTKAQTSRSTTAWRVDPTPKCSWIYPI